MDKRHLTTNEQRVLDKALRRSVTIIDDADVGIMRARIATLEAEKARLVEVVRRLGPHLDAIVCYASTMDEHEPNKLAHDARNLLNELGAK